MADYETWIHCNNATFDHWKIHNFLLNWKMFLANKENKRKSGFYFFFLKLQGYSHVKGHLQNKFDGNLECLQICHTTFKSMKIHCLTHTHTHILVISPNHGWYDTQCIQSVYYMQSWMEHYDVTCNRGRFVYEYDSSLITGDVTGAQKFLSFVNVLYIRFAIDCTTSQGGDRPRVSNVPGLIVECHTYVPGWRRLQTHTHTHTHIHL